MLSRTTVVVVALLGMSSALPGNIDQVKKRTEENKYDYVIIGGGVTGLVVANRLTEDLKS